MIIHLICAVAFLAIFAAPAYAFLTWFDTGAYDVTAFDINDRAYLAVFDTHSYARESTSETGETQRYYDTYGSIMIVDMTDPDWPRYVSSAHGSRDGFDIQGHMYDMITAVIGSDTYLFVISDHIAVLNVSDPENVSQTSVIPAGQMSGGKRAFGSIHQTGDIALAFIGSNIIDVSNPSSPIVVSRTLGGSTDGIVELSGRTYAMIDKRVLDVTEPHDPVQVDFDNMVRLGMWFETEYQIDVLPTAHTERIAAGAATIERIVVPDPSTMISAPMSDFTPDRMLELGDRLYILAHLHHNSGVWSGLIDVTDPEKPVAVPQYFPAGPKAVIAYIEGTYYAFPHPDFEWPGYSEWVFRLDGKVIGRTAWQGYSDEMFGSIGQTVPAAKVTYDPPAYWGESFTRNADGDMVSTSQYGVELDGRTYVLIDVSDQSHHDMSYAIVDVTDLLRDTPHVFRTDLVPGETLFLIAEYDNGTTKYLHAPNIKPGEWWHPQFDHRWEPQPPAAAYDYIGYQWIAGYSDGLWPGGSRIDSLMDIGERTYGLKRISGLYSDIVDMTDPLSVSGIRPVMRNAEYTMEDVSTVNFVEVKGVTHVLGLAGNFQPYTYEFLNSWPALSKYALPSSAPVSHGSELLPHQATWLHQTTWFQSPSETVSQDGYTDISHGGPRWTPSIPIPDDAVLTDADGRTYALTVLGRERSWESGIYATDIASGASILVPGHTLFGIVGDGLTVERGIRGQAILHDVSNPRDPTKIQPKGIHGGFFGLEFLRDAAVAKIGNKTYSVITSEDSGGAVQIIDISDPAELKPVSVVFAGSDDVVNYNQHLAIAYVFDRIYAVVAPWGNQAIQVMDITDPYKPSKMGSISLADGGFEDDYAASDVAVVHTSSGAYALMTNRDGDSVVVINISDPAIPTVVANIDTVDRPKVIETVDIGGRPHAVVLGHEDSAILDMTFPKSPSITAVISPSTHLKSPTDVAIADIGDRTYAIITSYEQTTGHVQILDISNPKSPSHVAGMTGGSGSLLPWRGFYGVETVETDDKTFIMVSASGGAQLVDITNPSRPIVGADIQGWPPAFSVELEGRTYVVSGGTDVVNATDPNNPEFVAGVGDHNIHYCTSAGVTDIFTWVRGIRCD